METPIKTPTRSRSRWCAGFLLLVTASAWGWSDHANLVWPLLRQQPALVASSVPAESLTQFLTAEQQAIAQTLENVERWAIGNIEHYPPTPEAHVFCPLCA
jgi:hypothetical protein